MDTQTDSLSVELLEQAGVPAEQARALVARTTTTVTEQSDDEDSEVRAALRALVLKAVQIAEFELDYGVGPDRLGIMKILLSRGLRDTSTTVERRDDMLMLFEEATQAVRDVKPRVLETAEDVDT